MSLSDCTDSEDEFDFEGGGGGAEEGKAEEHPFPPGKPISVFSGSFNMNGHPLTSEDANLWLGNAKGADLVILAFQEALAPSPTCIPEPSNNGWQNFVRKQVVHANDFQDALTNHQAFIKGCIDDDMSLVADVCMGEPATFEKRILEIDGENTEVEWYGFIRLMVYARNSLPIGEVRTLQAPTGNKKKGFLAPEQYPEEHSPDKGGVFVFLTGLDLAIINVHLAATNKYNTLEKPFDLDRLRQLRAIQQTEGQLPLARTILLGDLNFRTEIYKDTSAKCRKGREFQKTTELLGEGKLAELFTHDRLSNLISTQQLRSSRRLSATSQPGSPSHRLPSSSPVTFDTEPKTADEVEYNELLTASGSALDGFHDTLSAYLRQTNQIHMPTFTLKEKEEAPRKYWDKRTPAWTDRVLVKGFEPQNLAVRSIREIVASDHEPITVGFTIPMPKQTTISGPSGFAPNSAFCPDSPVTPIPTSATMGECAQGSDTEGGFPGSRSMDL